MSSDESAELDVLFVSMPFGPIHFPSIGLELLRQQVAELRSEILYFTLPFGEVVGAELYNDVCTRLFSGSTMVGEWVFSSVLDEVVCSQSAAAVAGTPADIDGYLDTVALAERVSPQELETLLQARSRVGEFLEECQQHIEGLRPRIVAFTSTFQQHVASLALAGRLKASCPDVFIVMGGANCNGAMGLETVRQFPFVDAVVSGEAETVFPDLVAKVLAGSAIDDLPGVYTQANCQGLDSQHPPDAPRWPEMDTLPIPNYDEFIEQWHQAELNTSEGPRLLFETSRGCWWGERQHCTFCGLNGNGMAFRSKSGERALDELTQLTQRHPGRRVLVVDNILDMKYFRDFLPALQEADLGVELFYEVKANLKKEQIRQLGAAGVREIQPGIESLSDSVLTLMRKGVKALQNVQLLRWCRELDVWPSWHLIWGFPGELPAEYERMAEMIPLLSHLPPPAATAQIRLDRFSPNFEQADELGFANVEPLRAYPFLYRLPRQALGNLAFAFDYEYQEPRDVAGYTQPVEERVADWRRDFSNSTLLAVEQGQQLWLWDLRPVAKQPLTQLSGLGKAVYQACDQMRSISWLAKQPWAELGSTGNLSRDQLEDEIGPLLDKGLMLRDGDYLLSLAIAGKAAVVAGKPA